MCLVVTIVPLARFLVFFGLCQHRLPSQILETQGSTNLLSAFSRRSEWASDQENLGIQVIQEPLPQKSILSYDSMILYDWH